MLLVLMRTVVSTWGMEHAIVTLAVIMIMIAVLMLCSFLDKVKLTTRTMAYRGVGHTNASLLAYRGVVIGYYTSVYHRLFPMPPSSSRIILSREAWK